jgi:lipopolysaccharide transport protein LptA
MRPGVLAACVLLVGALLGRGEAAPAPPSLQVAAPPPSPGSPVGPDGMGRLRADRIRYDLRARVMTAAGNVSLRLGDLEIRADALRVEQGPMVAMAEGNVRVRQRDTRLAAPSLRYEFRTEIAEARGGVVLEQQGATIKAPQVRFDLRTETTEATGGVEVVHSEGVLAAPSVRVDGRTRDVTADGGVTLTQPGSRVTGRWLKANLAGRWAEVREDVTLVRAGDPAPPQPDRGTAPLAREATTITAGRLRFRWDVNEAEAEDRVVVRQQDRTAWADRMTYSEPANRLVMTGHVVLEQLSGEWLTREGLAAAPRDAREREALASVTRLTCARLTMTLRERDIEADGPLVVTQKDRSASGDRGTYAHATRRMVVAGNVRMQEAGGQRLRADRVVISLVEETFEAEGNVMTEFVIRPGPTRRP